MLPNIGAQELLIIFVVALVVVGPRRLPELGRALGRGLSEFRKIQDEVRDMVKFDLSEEPAPSTPRPKAPAEPDAGPEVEPEPADPQVEQAIEPGSDRQEMTHSERVVALAAEEHSDEEPIAVEPVSGPAAPEAEVAEISPWIYDVMDDDEPDVEHPASGSAE